MILAGVFLGVAVVIWFAMLRPVPVRTASGVVRCKTFKAAGEYLQYPVGDRSNFRTPTRIAMPEHYVLEIAVDGRSDQFRYAVNGTAATAFEVGQRVTLEFQTRGLPPFWRRIYVLDAQPTN